MSTDNENENDIFSFLPRIPIVSSSDFDPVSKEYVAMSHLFFVNTAIFQYTPASLATNERVFIAANHLLKKRHTKLSQESVNSVIQSIVVLGDVALLATK